MATSTMFFKPNFVSTLPLSRRQVFEKSVGNKVKNYFQDRWPWTSNEDKVSYGEEDTEICSLLMCPHGPEDRAEVVAEYIVLLFMYDDVLESMTIHEAQESVRRMKNVMLYSARPQNPIEEIMYDVCTRIRSMGDDHSRQLAEIAITEGFEFLEAVVNRSEKCKSLDEGIEGYIKYRIKDVGYWATLRMWAWQMDLVTPPQHIWEDRDFIALTDVAVIHQLLINDLYSYRREVNWFGREDVQSALDSASSSDNGHSSSSSSSSDTNDLAKRIQGYTVFNAICALLQQPGVDESNVMEKMTEYIYRQERELNAVGEKLRSRYKDDKSDLGVINDWILFVTDNLAGNCVWSDLCRRYNPI